MSSTADHTRDLSLRAFRSTPQVVQYLPNESSDFVMVFCVVMGTVISGSFYSSFRWRHLMHDAKPEKEHLWLKKLVGEWTYEAEMIMGPDQPPMKNGGRESVRAIGDFWVLGEGTGTMPDGAPATMLITIGYDPAKKRYVGTWVGSMMPLLWVYDGEVDAAGKKLSLYAVGPNWEGEGTTNYCDAIEWVDDNHRIFTGSKQGADGKWSTFMTTHYYRNK
jgi:hypothetical protein